MVGHQPLKDELIAIMRRFDLDGDARLTFQEFTEALTPVQPSLIADPYRSLRGESPVRTIDCAKRRASFDQTDQSHRSFDNRR
jgi:Ca2+-binding EF-hand superfamily protein